MFTGRNLVSILKAHRVHYIHASPCFSNQLNVSTHHTKNRQHFLCKSSPFHTTSSQYYAKVVTKKINKQSTKNIVPSESSFEDFAKVPQTSSSKNHISRTNINITSTNDDDDGDNNYNNDKKNNKKHDNKKHENKKRDNKKHDGKRHDIKEYDNKRHDNKKYDKKRRDDTRYGEHRNNSRQQNLNIESDTTGIRLVANKDPRANKIESENEEMTQTLLFKENNEVRVSAIIARCGICSRRQADELIKQGVVKVNDEVVKELGTKATPYFHKISVHGKQLFSYFGKSQKKKVDRIEKEMEIFAPKLYVFNKTKGVLVSRVDSSNKGRETVQDFLNKVGQSHLMPVGRLDYNSEGLLLLTNDGKLSRYLESPDSKVERVYMVRVHGYVTDTVLEKVKRGSLIDGIHYGPIDASIVRNNRKQESNGKFSGTTWIQVKLWEGKNREIRKVFEHMHMPVSRLIRIRYGPFKLTKDVPKNSLKSIPIPNHLLEHCDQRFNFEAP